MRDTDLAATPQPLTRGELESVSFAVYMGHALTDEQLRRLLATARKGVEAESLLIEAESWLYHDARLEDRRAVAAKIRAFVCEGRADNPWRDSQRTTPPAVEV